MSNARARFAHNALFAQPQHILQTSAVLVKMFPRSNGIGGAWLFINHVGTLMKRGFEVGLLSGTNPYVDGAADRSRYQFQGSRLPV